MEYRRISDICGRATAFPSFCFEVPIQMTRCEGSLTNREAKRTKSNADVLMEIIRRKNAEIQQKQRAMTDANSDPSPSKTDKLVDALVSFLAGFEKLLERQYQALELQGQATERNQRVTDRQEKIIERQDQT